MYFTWPLPVRANPFEILRGADWRLKIKMCGGALEKKYVGGASAKKIKCGGGGP